MEFFGWAAFMLCLYYGNKLTKLERKVKKVEQKAKGEHTMSQLLQSLINQKVTIVSDVFFQSDAAYRILAVDEEWVKVEQINKKGKVTTTILRVDDIQRIELLAEA